LNAIGKMVDYIYRECMKIFTTSESFVESIHSRGVALNKIEYWPQYAEDFYLPKMKKNIAEIADRDAFNIIFAGNIGTAQGLDILPKVAEILKGKTKKKIQFNIVGD